jgi:hypothetical protein
MQYWNGTAWENDEQGTIIYNTSNDLINQTNQEWNGTAWANYFKITNTYNTNNMRTSQLNQNWNGATWVNQLLTTNTYDANNLEQTYTFRLWTITGDTLSEGDSIYYYFHAVTGINELAVKQKNIIVYPNPATNTLTIETLQAAVGNMQSALIEITNIQGQLVKTFMATGSKTSIDVSSFPPGVYFIEVKSEKGAEVQKFIKE